MQRHTIGKSFVAALLVTFISVNAAYAATSYTVVRGDTMYAIATKYNLTLAQLLALNPSVTNSSLIYPGQSLIVSGGATATSGTVLGTNTTKTSFKKKPTTQATTTTTVPKSATTTTLVSTTTPTTPAPVSGEKRYTAYTTGYGWPDNTPAGGEIALPVIHSAAGGTGTFADPVTLAVGHVIVNGKSTPDYAKGTKFYIPTLRKYFIVEDLCGDGATPQNGPCHTGYQGLPWLDLWVGGQGVAVASVYACENAITNTHLVIENPAANYAVVPGTLVNGSSCAVQYGDTVVTN